MAKQAYTVEGDFQMGRKRQHFIVEITGVDEEDARDHVYKDLGSRHGVPRRLVTIQSLTPLKAEDASPVTRKRMERSG